MTSLTTTTATPTGTGLTTAAILARFESIGQQLKAARANRDAAGVDPTPSSTPSSIDREEKWSLAMIQLKKDRCTLGSQMMVDIRALTAVAKQYGFDEPGDACVNCAVGKINVVGGTGKTPPDSVFISADDGISGVDWVGYISGSTLKQAEDECRTRTDNGKRCSGVFESHEGQYHFLYPGVSTFKKGGATRAVYKLIDIGDVANNLCTDCAAGKSAAVGTSANTCVDCVAGTTSAGGGSGASVSIFFLGCDFCFFFNFR